jgi:hypothetical protein
MTRRTREPPAKPAERNHAFEALIAEAIAGRRLVALRYKGEITSRLLAPHILFWSTQDKVCVTGPQVEDAGEAWHRSEARTFEVGLISELRLAEEQFVPDDRFDRHDERYRTGVIKGV